MTAEDNSGGDETTPTGKTNRMGTRPSRTAKRLWIARMNQMGARPSRTEKKLRVARRNRTIVPDMEDSCGRKILRTIMTYKETLNNKHEQA